MNQNVAVHILLYDFASYTLEHGTGLWCVFPMRQRDKNRAGAVTRKRVNSDPKVKTVIIKPIGHNLAPKKMS